MLTLFNLYKGDLLTTISQKFAFADDITIPTTRNFKIMMLNLIKTEKNSANTSNSGSLNQT